MNRMEHSSGIVAIQTGSGQWAIAYKPDKTLLCIGSFKQDDLADLYDDNDLVFIRFKEGKPYEFYPNDPTNYDVQPGELKIKIGSFFVSNNV